jgi:hypothetical protein
MHYVTLETKGPQLSRRLATEEQKKKRAFRLLFIPILALVGLKSGKDIIKSTLAIVETSHTESI